MDELPTWYEVIRSLLPQVYTVRMIRECGVIIAGSPYTDEIAYVTEDASVSFGRRRTCPPCAARCADP